MLLSIPSPSPARAALRFGRFELRTDERQLLIDGRPAPLGARAFELLVVLVERAGELVSKNELLERIWPGQVVEENNIAVQVNALRKLLGSELIVTVPGRGYRLAARVEGWAVAAPAAPATARGLPTHLPRVLPTLLGRADDLAALAALVDNHALVSVMGAGGIGKTLLVQHLLDGRRRTYRHGVCWVELAGVADASALPATIAEALGVRLGAGDAIDALAMAVGPLDLLLALDNAEQLAGPVGRLAARLIDAAPGLKLVVTSQAPLVVAAERVLRLGTLDLPPPGASLEQALASGAVALFVDRVQAANAHFTLTDANVAAVVTLCRSLDGLALAIELAAARAPMLGIQGLASSMGDRLRLLTRNRNREAPARQQTLLATLEWSHGFLDATEQAVFRRLAVVAGSCSLQLAQQIAADAPGEGPIDAWAVLDALDALVDRSLVSALVVGDDTQWRYRLLESPRAFALERLLASGEVDAVRRRHAEAVAARFDTAWDDYYSGRVGFDDWKMALELDFDNARAVLAWAETVDEPAVALVVGTILLRALPRSSYAERMALSGACKGLIGPRVPERIRRRAWLELGRDWLLGRLQDSAAAAKEALALAQTSGHPDADGCELYLARVLSVLVAARLKDLPAAEAALAAMREVENPAWPAQRLYWGSEAESEVLKSRGGSRRYLLAQRRALALNRAAGGSGPVHLANLMDAEVASGEASAAVQTGMTLIAQLEVTRNEYSLAFVRLNLVAALLALDDCSRARPVASDGWRQAERFELQCYWADYLALLAALEQRPAAAARLCGYSTARYVVSGQPRDLNEATALDRARRLAGSVLGDAAFERLQTEGRSLRYDDIAAIAFGADA